MLRSRRILALGLIIAVAGCHTKTEVGNVASTEGAEHVCSSCHGMQGRPGDPNFPVLAGQTKAYLITQLTAFHNKTRADPHARTYMWGMTANFDAATIASLASYYSVQTPPAPERADPDLAAAGEVIFKHGIVLEHVPPCATCHGAHAQGLANFPRLAGQHAVYLQDQLHAFQANQRVNAIMHANALHLTDAQIDAIAGYLSGL